MDFQKKRKILKFTLVFQGLYYVSTGLWAIISLDSFMRFTEHHGEPFEMYSIGAMAFVIGLFLLWSAFKEELRRPAGFLVLGLVLAIMIPELIYLPMMGNPILFWLDFVEEGVIGILVAFSLFSKPTKSQDIQRGILEDRRKMKIIDPVCGMTIDKENAIVTSSYKGITYYFCSDKCKEDFDKNSETILAMKAEREKLVEEERSKTLEKLIDEVAHEIRNPLTSIGGFTRRISERLPEGDPNKNYMKIVIEDVERLENMVKQLVKLKITSVLHTELSNINDAVIEALKSFEKEFRDNDIEVKTELVDNPPLISIDREKMTIAIANLIKNSIEAMQRTPKLLKIISNVSDENIEVVISDTGKGIPKDKIKYIFDPFFTSKIYGPGLGLTFTQRIIQEHNGTISVESEPGKGTTFTIRLPLKRS